MGNKKPQFSDEFCKYEFSDEEEKNLAQEMARKVSDLGTMKDYKKSVVKGLDGQIEEIDANIKSLSRKLQDHYEMRNVRCVVDMDFDTKTVRYIRTDNGEVCRARAMSASEVQIELDFFSEEEAKDESGDHEEERAA